MCVGLLVRLLIGLLGGLLLGGSIFYLGIVPNREVISLRDELDVSNLQLGEAQLNIAELNEISEKTRSDLIEAQQDLAAATEYMDALLISNSDIQFVFEDTYRLGESVEVKIMNVGNVTYYFSLFYEACGLSYFDSSGREFIIPPGTHCDLVNLGEIRPGARASTPHPSSISDHSTNFSLSEYVRLDWYRVAELVSTG